MPADTHPDRDAEIARVLRSVAEASDSAYRLEAEQRALAQKLPGGASALNLLAVKAASVFGSPERAARWFSEPAPGLRGERPKDMLASADGRRRVELLLRRLELSA